MGSRRPAQEFAIVWCVTMVFFFTFGMTLAVLPLYVTRELGGGSVTVGVVFAAYAVAAVMVRPSVGSLGSRFGPSAVLAGGCAVAAVGLVGHVVATTVPLMILARMAVGAGQAAVLVTSTTLALDLATPERQGESASYVLVGLQLGLGTGPLLGEMLLQRVSFNLVWGIASAGCLAGTVAAIVLHRSLPAHQQAGPSTSGLLDRRGVRPGVVMALGISGFAAFMAFIPLHGRQLGATNTAPAFLLLSGSVVVVRALGARLPDRLGPRRGGVLSLGVLSTGLAGVAFAPNPAWLYICTVALGAGSALLFPSLVLLAASGVTAADRVKVMATFTLFIDVANALAPVTLGVVVSAWGYGASFGVASLLGLIGIVLTLSWTCSWATGTIPPRSPHRPPRRVHGRSAMVRPVESRPDGDRPAAPRRTADPTVRSSLPVTGVVLGEPARDGRAMTHVDSSDPG